ncbi:esterase [Streptomyces sp. GS7]|uniref:esterase n=1 Tax=Streptomyces sp. GS7 TaxID=2692234 RepID=UPI001316E133|nr:esterase [Streptomyces sp. GS7]QHC23428.1 esterase [Streptomyces sp. GS7]
MPEYARGALVRAVPPLSTEPIHVAWSPTGNPSRLRSGSILLSWETSAHGGMDVTALLGLATTEVTLAIWPSLRGDWTSVVRPTHFEVTGLHAALSIATDALHLANRLADT